MKEIFCLHNRKGGSGKTCTADALGAGLMRRGFTVLFIDLDGQGNFSERLRADVTAPGALEILAGEIDIKETIQKTPCGDVIAASPAISENYINNKNGNPWQYRLKDALNAIKKDYDYIIIDTPPALSKITVAAFVASTGLIIPAEAENTSINGIKQTLETVAQIKQELNKRLKTMGILCTRYNGRAILSRDMLENLEEIAKAYKTRVFSVPIREAIAIKEARALQQDIFNYAPNSNPTADYNAFIDELLKA